MQRHISLEALESGGGVRGFPRGITKGSQEIQMTQFPWVMKRWKVKGLKSKVFLGLED